MVEIFLFPVRIKQVTPEHNTPCSSSKVPAPVGHSWLAPKWDFPQGEAARGAGGLAQLQVCSPCLADHSRRNWPQNPLHHGQVLPVVMGLGGRNVKGIDSSGSIPWNRFQWFCLQPWVFPHPEPLPGQHLGCLHRTAGMEVPPSLREAAKHPLTSWEVPTQHSSHLEKGETHIILKDDAANTPHITGLAPAKL